MMAARPAAKGVYLVSCVGKKRAQACRARDLYISPWFLKARAYVEARRSPWFILSAKYGLLAPDQIVAPYEETLNDMSQSQRRAWARGVIAKMETEFPSTDRVVVFAGDRYRQFLMDYLRRRVPTVEVPMQGMSIGKQLQFLSRGLIDERV